MKRVLLSIATGVMLFQLTACKESSDTVPQPEAVDPSRGVVLETMNVAGYTYAQIEQNGQKTWVAGPETTIRVGDRMDLPAGAKISDFYSKTLDRTFDTIIFTPGWNGAESKFPANHPAPPERRSSQLPPGHP